MKQRIVIVRGSNRAEVLYVLNQMCAITLMHIGSLFQNSINLLYNHTFSCIDEFRTILHEKKPGTVIKDFILHLENRLKYSTDIIVIDDVLFQVEYDALYEKFKENLVVLSCANSNGTSAPYVEHITCNNSIFYRISPTNIEPQLFSIFGFNKREISEVKEKTPNPIKLISVRRGENIYFKFVDNMEPNPKDPDSHITRSRSFYEFEKFLKNYYVFDSVIYNSNTYIILVLNDIKYMVDYQDLPLTQLLKY